MKIGIETQVLTSTIRGVGYYVFSLIEALQKQNQELLSFSSKKNHPKVDGVTEHFYSQPPPIPLVNSVLALFRSSIFEKADLIHFPAPKIYYGKRPNVPVVMTVHDLMALRFPKLFPKRTHILMKCLLLRYLKEADLICAVSEATKKEILHYYPISPEKIHVIHLPLLSRKREVSYEKEPFIFYVGSFEPRKNLPRIIEVFALLKKEGFPHKLILAGKEQGTHQIPWDLIKKLGIEKEVIHKGYVTEEEKDHLFQKAALFIWPSLYEGFGLPLLEAMAFGTPILTSNNSSIPEVVGDAAECVDPEDTGAIFRGALKILNSQEHAHTLMAKGAERAKMFSIEEFGKKHVELYQSVLN